MSVISTMEATPNRIAILYRFLAAQHGPLHRDQLVALLSPLSLQSKEKDVEEKAGKAKEPYRMAKRVLSEARALGLVEMVTEEGNLQVPEHLRNVGAEGLRAFLEQRLTHPEEAAVAEQPHLPQALAWFLNQPAASPLTFGENKKREIEASTQGRSFDLTNTARFQQFSYWVQYLGLGWQVHGAAGVELVSDPTTALIPHLRALLAGAGEVPIRQVIESLAQRLPVMETGVVRQEVEGWLPPSQQRGDSELSQSTSLALIRLQRRGVIGLEHHSDASVMRLRTWPETRVVSHLVWKQTSQGR